MSLKWETSNFYQSFMLENVFVFKIQCDLSRKRPEKFRAFEKRTQSLPSQDLQ